MIVSINHLLQAFFNALFMSLNLSALNPKIYHSGAIVIGCLQVIDGILAWQAVQINIATAFSLLELIWFFVSILYFTAFWQRQLSTQVPSCYLIYYFSSWLYGSYLLVNTPDTMSLTLPTGYIIIAIMFGIFYSILGYRHYQKCR